jgi:hypothetical protein
MTVQQQPDVCYKFIKESSGVDGICPEPPTKVKISLYDDVSLDILLESFRNFLVASGFELNQNESVAIIRETTEERDPENESDSEI